MIAVAAATLAIATSTPTTRDGRSERKKVPRTMPPHMIAAAARAPAAARSGDCQRALALELVLGLDDHPARPRSQEVGGSRTDAPLARRRVDRRPVDDVRADALGFGDERRAGVARPDQRGVDLDSAPPCLDTRALEHGQALRFLALQAGLQRELARNRKHGHRIHAAAV